MLRPSLTTAAVALLCTGAMAQGDLKSRLQPITSPLKHAGVYHVATGRWTHGGTLANGSGPDIIYNNSCASVYYTGMLTTEKYQHRSRIPSLSGPTTDSIFYGTSDTGHRYDERPGCANSYNVNGFEVAYCSSHIGTIDWQYQFANSYTVCGAGDMVPTVTLNITGLPGGNSVGGQICWIIDLDVATGTTGFVLSADGDGTYNGPSTADQFGWSFNPTSTIIATDSTGPLIAGDFTWTGGVNTGPLTPCTGTDGTIWDRPVQDPTEFGTGMSSLDAFRDTGTSISAPSGPGCYFFGGNPHGDFYLKLFGNPGCPPDDPLTKFCAPGVGGIVTCPCGNPQVPAGATKGCNNFAGGGTGGAILSGVGNPKISADTFGTSVTAGVGANVTVMFQGTTNTVNTRTGAGVRCVGGTLKRVYKGNQAAGAINFPNNAVPWHTQSAAKGYTIVPPITLYYYAAYRNSAANGQPGCPGLTFGFNSTNAGSTTWQP